MRVLILDGYVDEPSCLGVPPYLSPYPRYVAGAVEDAGGIFSYFTIEQVRKGARLDADILVLIAGSLVPGRYLRGMPISDKEIEAVAETFEGIKILGGPLVRFGLQKKCFEKAFDHLARKDVDACVFDLITSGSFADRERNTEEWARWAVMGAKLARSHPDYPQPLIAELDVSRGCVRYFTGGCSFCIEPSYGTPIFREPSEVIKEIEELSKNGVSNFRLGGQACFFSYHANGVGETETPEPNPEDVETLLRGIRKVSPNLHVLHTDNANPALIATHPDKSREILKMIVKYCTSGNVLSLGMESADPKVIEMNNLNARPDQVMKAIEMVNAVGSIKGPTGLPVLLPGINLISGLRGESEDTFDINLGFLKDVLNSGNLLRRINLRQVLEVRGKFPVRRYYKEFRQFKKRVREEIDRPMLKRVVPEGTILRDVYLELRKGKTTYGRQIGSYPILIGLPYQIQTGVFIDVRVIGHGYRSLTCIEHPLDLNKASLKALSNLPGIGMKRAARIVRARPIRKKEDLVAALDDTAIAEKVLNFTTMD